MWREFEDPFEAAPLGSMESAQPGDHAAGAQSPRFYADERFPTLAIQLLRSAGAQVCTAAEADLLDQPAEAHASYALAHGLALLTCDPQLMDEQRFPLQRCPMVFVLDFGSGSLRDVRRTLRCLAPVLGGPGASGTRCKVEGESDAWVEHYRRADGSHARICRRLWRGRMQAWIATPLNGTR